MAPDRAAKTVPHIPAVGVVGRVVDRCGTNWSGCRTRGRLGCRSRCRSWLRCRRRSRCRLRRWGWCRGLEVGQVGPVGQAAQSCQQGKRTHNREDGAVSRATGLDLIEDTWLGRGIGGLFFVLRRLRWCRLLLLRLGLLLLWLRLGFCLLVAVLRLSLCRRLSCSRFSCGLRGILWLGLGPPRGRWRRQ